MILLLGSRASPGRRTGLYHSGPSPFPSKRSGECARCVSREPMIVHDVSMTNDRNGWRPTFLHRSHVPRPGSVRLPLMGRRRGEPARRAARRALHTPLARERSAHRASRRWEDDAGLVGFPGSCRRSRPTRRSKSRRSGVPPGLTPRDRSRDDRPCADRVLSDGRRGATLRTP